MAPITISVPRGRAAMRAWTCEVVFGRMLGLPYVLAHHDAPETRIALPDGTLSFPDRFLADETTWLAPDSVPAPPFVTFDPQALAVPVAGLGLPLPVLYGEPIIVETAGATTCGIDVLGTIAFCLSRYEEVAAPARDARDRYPGLASVAARAGYNDRPLVDEYVALIAAMMTRLSPGLMQPTAPGTTFVTCDVDSPYEPSARAWPVLARTMAGDLLKRRRPGMALRRVRNALASRRADYRFDECYTFDWYMDVCERNGLRAAFYFIPDHSGGAIDGDYDLHEPRIQQLLRKLGERGHELGVHGSYNTYRDPLQLRKERARMVTACEAAGVDARVLGSRQHFLRWDSAETPDHLDAAGFTYDTSGSFADLAGFRYGTSRAFPMWSWARQAPLGLLQRPLIMMESSVIAPRYMGLGYSPEAFEAMLMLKRRCLIYGGEFTMLWHNSHFTHAADREFFEQLIVQA